MIQIQPYCFAPEPTAITVEFTPDAKNESAVALVKFYDVLGDYVGCRSITLGIERMHYFEKNDVEGATAFVLQRLGITQI